MSRGPPLVKTKSLDFALAVKDDTLPEGIVKEDGFTKQLKL